MKREKEYKEWMEHLETGDPLRTELEQIRDSDDELEERFYTELAFGTAGVRGIYGAGTNRMNRFVIGRITQGLANVLLRFPKNVKRGVVICYDCRYHSKEFAVQAAEILAGNGIPVFIFDSIHSTPELAFKIRDLGAFAGLNLTASHNPKNYNGYKVYWNDGAQISEKVSKRIQDEITKLSLFDSFPSLPYAEGVSQGIIRELTSVDDLPYLDYVRSLRLRENEELDLSLSMVYTPLNGAGIGPISTLMNERGYTSFHVVEAQKDPDPEFTTTVNPNPEDPKAFALAEQLGSETDADLLIATDPDSDRMAIEVRDPDGHYVFLNGNQTGGLLIHYLAETKKEKGLLKDTSVMVQSIVTGDFGRTVCYDYGIEVINALTGFKNICGWIPEIKSNGKHFFFGYEESIGCAPAEPVRDKDGIAATLIIAEMASWYKKQGITLYSALQDLYKKYGYFSEAPYSYVLEGEKGKQRIVRIMETIRNEDPKNFGTYKVTQKIDYIDGYREVPASNVLKFCFGKDTWFAMRPSGTEPKLKFYFYTRQDNKETADIIVNDLKKTVLEQIDSIE